MAAAASIARADAKQLELLCWRLPGASHVLSGVLVALTLLLSGCVTCRFFVEGDHGASAQSCSLSGVSEKCCDAIHKLELEEKSTTEMIEDVLQDPSTTCTKQNVDSFRSGEHCQNVKGTIRTFVMSGQSNMEGFGRVMGKEPGTLEAQINDERTKEIMAQLWSEYMGSWAVFPSISMAYCGLSRSGGCKSGHLSTGFGVDDDMIGPELGFGVGLRNAFSDKEQILILKHPFSSKSLAVDFRPPSSTRVPDTFCSDTCKKCGSGFTCQSDKVGEYYTKLVDNINLAMYPGQLWQAVPETYGRIPDLSGFVWFQGWSDGDWACHAVAYEQNLVNLIMDVRAAWKKRDLPIVVGVSGFFAVGVEQDLGWDYHEMGYTSPSATCESRDKITCDAASSCDSCDSACRHHQVLRGQFRGANATLHPKLIGNVLAMETRGFWRNTTSAPDDTEPHHWHQAGESYFLTGQALAAGMLQLLGEGGATTESELHSKWFDFGERSITMQKLRASDLWPPGLQSRGQSKSSSRLYDALWRGATRLRRSRASLVLGPVVLLTFGAFMLVVVRWRRWRRTSPLSNIDAIDPEGDEENDKEHQSPLIIT